MPKEKILVVDDEPDILTLLEYNFKREGFCTSCVTSGEEALQSVLTESPDLVVLDLMLPGIDGLEVARHLKMNHKTEHISIIMLTAKTEEVDIVTGLEIGADDYVTKPFSPRILIARIKSILRRKREKPEDKEEIIHRHGLTIHPGHRSVQLNGEQIGLTLAEFSILNYLARSPGWVFSRSQIIDEVHGRDYSVTERSVDVQVVGLRKKLREAGKYIETVRGIGYRFRE
jgi:two-component system phosphate regulon response regulator PhoB